LVRTGIVMVKRVSGLLVMPGGVYLLDMAL
jgi:hypothetical protein